MKNTSHRDRRTCVVQPRYLIGFVGRDVEPPVRRGGDGAPEPLDVRLRQLGLDVVAAQCPARAPRAPGTRSGNRRRLHRHQFPAGAFDECRGMWTRIAAATAASMPLAGRVSPVSQMDWTATATSDADAPSRIQCRGSSLRRSARTPAAVSDGQRDERREGQHQPAFGSDLHVVIVCFVPVVGAIGGLIEPHRVRKGSCAGSRQGKVANDVERVAPDCDAVREPELPCLVDARQQSIEIGVGDDTQHRRERDRAGPQRRSPEAHLARRSQSNIACGTRQRKHRRSRSAGGDDRR